MIRLGLDTHPRALSAVVAAFWPSPARLTSTPSPLLRRDVPRRDPARLRPRAHDTESAAADAGFSSDSFRQEVPGRGPPCLTIVPHPVHSPPPRPLNNTRRPGTQATLKDGARVAIRRFTPADREPVTDLLAESFSTSIGAPEYQCALQTLPPLLSDCFDCFDEIARRRTPGEPHVLSRGAPWSWRGASRAPPGPQSLPPAGGSSGGGSPATWPRSSPPRRTSPPASSACSRGRAPPAAPLATPRSWAPARCRSRRSLGASTPPPSASPPTASRSICPT